MQNSFVQKYLKLNELVEEVYGDDPKEVFGPRSKFPETVSKEDMDEYDFARRIYESIKKNNICWWEEWIEYKTKFIEDNKQAIIKKKEKIKQNEEDIRKLEESCSEEYKFIKVFLATQWFPYFTDLKSLVEIMKEYFKKLTNEKIEYYCDKYKIKCYFKRRKIKKVTEKYVSCLSELEIKLLLNEYVNF